MDTPLITRLLSRSPALLSLVSSAAFAGTVSPDVNRLRPGEAVQMIVQFAPQTVSPNSATTAITSILSLPSVAAYGASIIANLPNGQLCLMTPEAAIALAKTPSVAHISVNHTLHGTGQSAPLPVYDYLPQTLHPNSIAAAGQPDLNAGDNIGVAVIDSGIMTTSLDLINNSGNGPGHSTVVYAKSFVPNEPVDDYYGHGTHIAGIIAGDGSNSSGPGYVHDIHGVAPGVNLINLKVLDKNGASTDAEVIAAIDWAIQNKRLYNIKVINMSLGRGVFESYKVDPLCQEVEKAWLAGITVVVAAGNGGRYATTHGYFTIDAPANDPLVITVGAVNTKSTPSRGDDVMTSYSSKGPTYGDHVVKPDLIAPGNKIFSTRVPNSTLEMALPSDIVPLGSYVKNPSNGMVSEYFMLSGTSMSAAATSGAVATLLGSQGNHNLTPDQVKARFDENGLQIPPEYRGHDHRQYNQPAADVYRRV
jgi:serine protease AprX